MARSGNYQRPWEVPHYQSSSQGGYYQPQPRPATTSQYPTGHDVQYAETNGDYEYSSQDHQYPQEQPLPPHMAMPQPPPQSPLQPMYNVHAPLPPTPQTKRYSKHSAATIRKLKIIIIILIIIILVLVIVLPIYFLVIRPASTRQASDDLAGSGADSTGSSAAPEPTATDRPVRLTRGGDQSVITMENGTTFTYSNPFGGFWVHDPEDPFNLGAQPNSWTPPLNTSWRWGSDRVFGVNLGGLFVLEPFINPSVYQRYPGAVDEYTLTELMRAEGAMGGPGLRVLEEHYDTFITEQDIAEIAGSGLNWIRVPIGFWAIETYEGEPFLERVSWRYFLRVIEWARKYGLRVFLDLHAVPGSQNGMNHSARRGQVNLLAGNMGIANAQRLLYYLRILTQFISQPQYKDLIPMIGIVNEPESRATGQDALRSFYLEAYRIIREITGYGEGNGPYIVVGDGFLVTQEWLGLMPNADRFVMDVHPYLAFDEGPPNVAPLTEPSEDGFLGGTWPRTACARWAYINETKRELGVTIAGEFSGAINDCGLFIREVDRASEHPQCEMYNNWETWSDEVKWGLESFIMASFDAIGDFFWWTWKVGPSSSGRIEAPFWSYQLGLHQGWIPRDPRESIGKCAALGFVPEQPFNGTYQPWHTGSFDSANPPTIPAEYVAAHPWPPAVIYNTSFSPPLPGDGEGEGEGEPGQSEGGGPTTSGRADLLPTYAFTGSPVITLPVPTYTGAPTSVTSGVDGWFNDEDRGGAVVPVAGCPYPDPYIGAFDVLPTAPCTGPTGS
ncbi:glycoside hydrolase [Coprinopsis marcescibilis]|uniref:glucan 1,3-beta-glucosidase n=1 Tax=Coprinopsis marcescibilis TaxID=230819 RepID=A0A5C3KQJ8_COPMA|nr:glycoside hydrolase [Coprinopsis marcescibilis]